MSIPGFESFDRVWFLTWTTYGTWLPGDSRGFVSPKFAGGEKERRNNIVGNPYDVGRSKLLAAAKANLVGDAILLESAHAELLKTQFEETAAFRGWTLVVAAVMRNHVHLVVGIAGNPDPSYLMRDFKSYGSRTLNRLYGKPASGTWWAEQGSNRKVKNKRHYDAVVRYVLHQEGALLIWLPGERGGVSPLKLRSSDFPHHCCRQLGFSGG